MAAISSLNRLFPNSRKKGGLCPIHAIEFDMPLLNIVKSDPSISFSIGAETSVVGQISDDGTQMSLPANDPLNPGAMVVFEKQ